ncbi:hypothetical protein J421_4632 (plasmid) [Gemmatirosa kalamazoonensis]|uniref:Uncharacterized protein n=1 Tax=Gemmatirosa kalamazoonensis TaxID=861299 RepID=W0RLZ0_9BACT|nr:hypothetical protein [Gemmatirosa kalamazoonensis]AHG92099.1 hypothetical protein J421_4564 [Gemmatirosa kalamazoonensis]AHG92167.1 hypothetical protein J421_4632 [Gemmatirosa kalamazoonensis]
MATALGATMSPIASDLDRAIAQLHDAARRLGEARAHEMALEDRRALVKRDAILRLLESSAATSATAAEKIVEQDADYARHRGDQRAAVIATLERWAEWEAARCRAWTLARAPEA